MKPHRCETYLFVRWLKHGSPVEGQPWTCEACGRSSRYRGGRWVEVNTMDEIKDLIANDPRGHLIEGDE